MAKNLLRLARVPALTFAAWLSLAASGVAQPEHTQQRVALVIGNGEYSNPLTLPHRAAEVAAEGLASLGFAVDLHFDLDQSHLEAAILDFASKLDRDRIGFFYFAGHVLDHEGRRFLLPVGAEVREVSDLRYRAMDLGFLLENLGAADNKLDLVVLESCRESPLPRLASGTPPSLTSSVHVFVAHGRGPCTASEGAALTDHLLKQLAEPGLTLDQVFARAREAAEGERASVAFGPLAAIRDFPLPPVQGPGVIDRGLKPNTLAGQTGELPKLWPPPRPTTFYPLPDERWRGTAATVGTVAKRLEKALQDAGYCERAYYAVPGGFALVTNLEQIEEDGRPKQEQRWGMDTVLRAGFSLDAVAAAFRRLFSSRVGIFRLLVLVLTPEDLRFAEGALEPDKAESLVSAGIVPVPRELAKLKLTEAHHLTLVVYEFEKLAATHELRAVITSPRTGQLHFLHSSLADTLEATP